jgi:hypothetical protein
MLNNDWNFYFKRPNSCDIKHVWSLYSVYYIMEAVKEHLLFKFEESFPSIYFYIYEPLVWHIMYLPVYFVRIQTSKQIWRS